MHPTKFQAVPAVLITVAALATGYAADLRAKSDPKGTGAKPAAKPGREKELLLEGTWVVAAVEAPPGRNVGEMFKAEDRLTFGPHPKTRFTLLTRTRGTETGELFRYETGRDGDRRTIDLIGDLAEEGGFRRTKTSAYLGVYGFDGEILKIALATELEFYFNGQPIEGEERVARPASLDAKKAVRLTLKAAPREGPKPDGEKKPAAAPAGTCRVTGALASSEYAKSGGSLERAIVSVLTDPGRKQVAHSNEKGSAFAFDLPPGEYVLECTGVGSRGATFVPTGKKFAVKAGDAKLDLGEIDMPASKVTKLFGKPAPELDGVVAWKNTEALTLKGLKGKVVVLDFWSYSCSICLHHKPDLVKLLEKYKGKELVVLTVHDSSAESMDEVDKKAPDLVKKKAGQLPVVLDGKGEKSLFQSYGITAVPMVVVIDQEGTVVRRFHHAGDANLDKEVGHLLGKMK